MPSAFLKKKLPTDRKTQVQALLARVAAGPKPPRAPSQPRTVAKPDAKPATPQPKLAAVKAQPGTLKRGPEASRKTAKTKNEWGTHSSGASKPGKTSADLTDRAALVKLFGLEHLPAEVLDLVSDGLPGVMDALIRGASNPGLTGNADRVMLFKLLGAEWAQPAHRSNPDAKAGAAGLGELGDRIGRAVGRVEKHLVGHAAVTVDDADRSKLAAILAPQSDGHMMVDHGRYPSGGAKVDMDEIRASLAAALAVGDGSPGDEGPTEDAGDEGALAFGE